MDKKVIIKTKYDDNYSMISPTDASGGVNGRGELVINLTSDFNSIPESEEFLLDDQGQIDLSKPSKMFFNEIEKNKNEIKIDRIIHKTIKLNPNSAIDIAVWMIETILNNNKQLDRNNLKEKLDKIIMCEKDE